jgi:protein involved in ribonucleotide reduction
MQQQGLPQTRIKAMAKKQKKLEDAFVFFDITYEDGTKSSRRKINAAGLDKTEVEAFALTEIMTQDRKIAEMGGKNRGQVKDMVRSAG